MEKKNRFTRFLAMAGTVLLWLVILAPVVFSVIRLIRARMFNFDFLLYAELGLMVLGAALMLLWAALRAHKYGALIGGLLALAVVAVVAGQGVAVATGLASGEVEAAGWPWVLTVGLIVVYDLAVVALGLAGILLVRALYANPPESNEHLPG